MEQSFLENNLSKGDDINSIGTSNTDNLEEENDQDKEKKGGVNSKGIYNNFSNEYNGFITAFNMGGIEEVKKWVKEFKAEDPNFKIKEYNEIINDENKDEVEKINKLILELNDILSKPDDLDEKEFERIINNLNFIIYERHDFTLDVFINSKGISTHFSDQYTPFISAYENNGGKGLKDLLKTVKEDDKNYKIPGYNEKVTDENRKEIEEINKLVFELNNLFDKPDDIDEREFVRIINKLDFIIYEGRKPQFNIDLAQKQY